MPPKRKGQTMALDEFLGDERFFGGGSWADEDMPLPMAVPSGDGWGTNDMNGAPGLGGPSLTTVVIPTAPPYTARVQNLSYDVTEPSLSAFFREKGLRVDSVRLPKDPETGRLRGSGFVDFEDRDSLAKAVELGSPSLLGRTMHISVAEQRRGNDGMEANWRLRRDPSGLGPMGGPGGPPMGGRYREPEPELDWASARNSAGGIGGERPPRGMGGERSYGPPDRFSNTRFAANGNFERRPPPPEEDLDWGARRGPVRGDGPPRSGGFGSGFGGSRPPRPPREPEPEFDWSVRAPQASAPRRTQAPRREHSGPRRDEVDRGFEDWGRRRAQGGPAPSAASSGAAAGSTSTESQPARSGKSKIEKLQRGFAALDIEGDDNDNDNETETVDEEGEKKIESVAELQKAEREQKEGNWTKA